MSTPVETARSAPDAYEPGAVLHRGRRSLVVAASSVEDGRPVVLKVVAPGSADPHARRRLRHEHQLLRRIEAPGVVRTEGLVVSSLGLSLVLEPVDGQPLRTLIGRAHDLETVLSIGVELARAVVALHRAGVAHLALSPDNVLWDARTRKLVVVDLASGSRIPRPATDPAGRPLDEVAYLSPEQTGRMNRAVDARSDLWAVGVVLFELITGSRPFEGDDVLGLVHAIVAREPEPLVQGRSGVPDVVGTLVAKLLAKSPDERYQSATGVLVDLEAIRSAWRDRRPLDAIRLGASDRSERLRLPSALYGRAADVTAVRTAAERCLAGELAGVVVVGPAGIGKSALVQELRPWAAARGGHFGAGKFDQLRRSVPYAPLVAALEPVLRQLLAGSALQVERWRDRLRSALGPAADVLREVIPTAGELLPRHGTLRELPPVEARGRALAALLDLLRVLHAPDAPLVLFLDDLQWADAGTVDLVEALLRAPDARNPVLVLAWRDNEVPPGHPLDARLGRLGPDVLARVALGPLGRDDVARLLVDTLGRELFEVGPLAKEIVAKTSGNPFFVRTFVTALVERGTLAFDAAAQRWAWDLQAIVRDGVTDNVVDLLSARLAGQSEASRALVAEVACFGQRVDLDLLATGLGRSVDAVRTEALPLIEAGLLVTEGTGWNYAEGVDDTTDGGAHGTSEVRFPHDRVQQAAYALVPAELRPSVHLRLVRQLIAAALEQREERLFAVADQVVLALDAVGPGPERRQLARLLARAGQRARAAAAFGPTLQYLEGAARLLDGDVAPDEAALAFRVHHGAAEAGVVLGRIDLVEAHLAAGALHAPTDLDELALEQIRIRAHLARGEQREAVTRTLAALATLGERFPEHPSVLQAGWALARTTLAVRRHGLEALRKLPTCDDDRVKVIVRLMSEVTNAAYLWSPNLSLVFFLRIVDLSLERGVVAESGHGWAGYALLVAAAMNDPERARAYSDLAAALVERFDAVHVRGKVDVVRLGFVHTRLERLADLVDVWDAVQRSGLEGGDISTAGLASTDLVNYAFYAGMDLEELEARVAYRLAFARRIGEERSAYWHELFLQLVDGLRGRAPDPLVLDGTRLDLERWLERCRASGDTGSIASHDLLTMQVRVLLGAPEAAGDAADAAMRGRQALYGTHMAYFVTAYAALVDVALARKALATRRPGEARRRRRAARAKLRWLKPWLRPGSSYVHLERLIRAELADLAGRTAEADAAYDEAVRLAKGVDHTHEVGLALELAGRAYLRRGLGRSAAAYLADARAAFVQWGGTARLERFEPLLRDAMGLGAPVRPLDPFVAGPRTLDAAAVAVAARALSGEIRLQALLERLLRLLVEAGGATSGALVLVRDRGPRVVGTARVTGDGVAVETCDLGELERARTPAEALGPFASVLTYVLRTRERLVLDDIAADARFAAAFRGALGSVIAAPLLRANDLVGAVLLENRLARGAFTAERLEVVGVLASQAAVSLENALLYESLERSLDAQTQLTRAYQRFVPRQFLDQLGKESILDVALGDQVQQEITVLFADIRGFSAVAERLGPGGTFGFINRYLAHMEPAIHAHGGYINQYLGDGILALFPGSADQALRGALAMLDALDQLNHAALAAGDPTIRIGIGLNTGPLVVGTIGGLYRMDRGIVGDAINVASRIEGMCKVYGTSLLVSGETRRRLTTPERFTFRLLDRVVASGKSVAVEVHEVLDGEAEPVRSGKLGGRHAYETGLERWRRAEFSAARIAFGEALGACPDDRAAALFVERCQEREGRPLPGEWDGVSRLSWK
jgi:predicted ATPase/class 3 adenylate cyclase